MQKLTTLIALGFLVLNSACSKTSDFTITEQPIARAPLILPTVEPLQLHKSNWKSITINGEDLFALNRYDYDMLNADKLDILELIEKQKTIIKTYEEEYAK